MEMAVLRPWRWRADSGFLFSYLEVSTCPLVYLHIHLLIYLFIYILIQILIMSMYLFVCRSYQSVSFTCLFMVPQLWVWITPTSTKLYTATTTSLETSRNNIGSPEVKNIEKRVPRPKKGYDTFRAAWTRVVPGGFSSWATRKPTRELCQVNHFLQTFSTSTGHDGGAVTGLMGAGEKRAARRLGAPFILHVFEKINKTWQHAVASFPVLCKGRSSSQTMIPYEETFRNSLCLHEQ